MTFRVGDIDKTKAFYTQALAPIGYNLAIDEIFDGNRVLGFSKNNKIDTWFTNHTPVSGPTHIAWAVDSRKIVDDFYEAALKAGGRDNGKPGPRPHYHENYYGAFVLDPDGNNIEAVCHIR